jgi:hypothetical protein
VGLLLDGGHVGSLGSQGCRDTLLGYLGILYRDRALCDIANYTTTMASMKAGASKLALRGDDAIL